MRPIIGAVWTSTGKGERHERYEALAQVWKFSAGRIFRKSGKIICHDAPPYNPKTPCPSFGRGDRRVGPSKTLAWRVKLRHWAEIVREAPIGTPVLMTDIDIAFFSDPFPDLFSGAVESFDVGFCNQCTGAVYFSGSEASHSFMSWWLLMTEELFRKPELYQVLDKKYLGLDQCSFQLAAAFGSHGAKIIDLPNRFHSTIKHHELPAHVFHFHGKMRGGAVGTTLIGDLPQPLQKYCVTWRKMHKKVLGKAQRAALSE